MNKELNILILEDVGTDAELMEDELRKEGISFSSKLVESEDDFCRELKEYNPDVILSDYKLPTFNGMSALKLTKEVAPSTPLIIVTGSINEEIAVECMKAGAADYVLKDSLSRLGPTVNAAMEMKKLIEDRRNAEEALRKSEEFNRRIIECSNDCINILDLEGRLLFMNDGGQELLEIDDVNSLLNKSWLEYWEGAEKQLAINALRNALHSNIGTFQGYCPTWKGKPKWWDVVITPMINGEGNVERLLAVSRDITELKNQSAQLMQVERMSTVGTLASGVAHELNNPLMSVLGFTQYCLKHTPDTEKNYDVLRDIEHEATRCVDIVTNLLTFSHMGKEGVEKKQDASCADILERVLKLLSYRIEKERVKITKKYQKGSIDAWVQVNSIQQVFLNIIVNAFDALKTSEKKEIHIEIQYENEITRIVIEDSGSGIPPKNLERIFEPFYTTKEVGSGTGLGLSISKSLVENNNGKLTCESEVGKGTKFIIQLSQTKRELSNEKVRLSN
jgi:PAS domain S-box-containing protein